MAFQDDHKNLTDPVSGTPAFDPRDPSTVRARLMTLVTGLSRGGRRGGTLYVPRVAGGQLWVDVTTALYLPRGITLAVAPGVVIVPVFTGASEPTEENHLEIEGVLDAPIATIFATAGWFRRRNAAGGPRYGVGVVRLTSPHLERVHPEWWGAADPADRAQPDDSEALEAAVRASLRDRVGRDPTLPLLRTLAVELRGAYTLTTPLRFNRGRTDPPRGLTLRGVPGADGQPTFRCAEASVLREPMLTVEGFESVTLQDLRFDAGERAPTCLAIRDPSPSVTARAHVVRRCSFRDAWGPLVAYDAASASATSNAPVGVRSSGARFDHCRFERVPPVAGSGAALDASAPPAVTVELRGCVFRGPATAMVHARSCALAVTSCHFDNSRVPPTLRASGGQDRLHAEGPEGGVDIFLDRVARSPAATLYAQDCRSGSVQFLATLHAGDAAAPSDSTVVALHHARAVRLTDYDHIAAGDLRYVFDFPPLGYIDPKPGVMVPKPPRQPINPGTPIGKTGAVAPPAVIDWRIPPGSSAAKLVLVGCRFDGELYESNPAVRGFDGSGDVVDLGVLHGDGRGRLVASARHVQVPPRP